MEGRASVFLTFQMQCFGKVSLSLWPVGITVSCLPSRQSVPLALRTGLLIGPSHHVRTSLSTSSSEAATSRTWLCVNRPNQHALTLRTRPLSRYTFTLPRHWALWLLQCNMNHPCFLSVIHKLQLLVLGCRCCPHHVPVWFLWPLQPNFGSCL